MANKYKHKKKKKESIIDKSIASITIPKVGRPSKYDKDIHPTLVIMNMVQGKSLVETAYDMGIPYITLWHWAHKDENKPEFLNAIKIGEKLSEGWWEKMGRLNIGNKEFNSILWMMNMSNRHGWSRKVTEDRNIKQEIKQLIVHKQVNEIDATATIIRILEGAGKIKSIPAKTNSTTIN